jgi:hypothetical protein
LLGGDIELEAQQVGDGKGCREDDDIEGASERLLQKARPELSPLSASS